MNLKQFKEYYPDKLLPSNYQALKKDVQLGNKLKDEIVLASKPFFTVQGEGTFSGAPSIFFRMAYCSLQCHFCSVYDTPVILENGQSIPISEIEPKMRILNKNLKDKAIFSNDLLSEEVQNIIKRIVTVEEMIAVKFFGVDNPLIVTKDHLFLKIRGNTWVRADELKYDMLLMGDTSDFGFHKSVFETRPLNEAEIAKYSKKGKVEVYSLQLTHNKNYFTGGLLSQNCDTPEWMTKRYNYSFEGLYNAFQDENAKCKLLICTGGEPALQLSNELVDYLHSKDYKINVETSGSIWNEAFEKVDYVCCSPKRLSDQINKEDTQSDKYIINKNILPFVDEYKFIIDDKTNINMLLNFVNEANNHKATKDPVFWLSPMDCYNEEQNKKNIKTILNIIQDFPDTFKFNIQMHKVIGVD
jgi:organic radical activating enzyme